jgi:hypothetical protein
MKKSTERSLALFLIFGAIFMFTCTVIESVSTDQKYMWVPGLLLLVPLLFLIEILSENNK